jgi:3-hydroxy-3-methylglutaryl CoA synthase/uncharacterized OB-fold protein
MTTRSGVLAYGAYLPYWRLERKAIAAQLGGRPAPGTRSVASYDEDTTSMGVEAARIALRNAPLSPRSVFFTTTDPAYQDKTNATAITAALSLGPDILSADIAGAPRSATAAFRAALGGAEPSLVVLSDIRTGLPGSSDERDGGDAAVAFVLGPDEAGPLAAEYIGGASVSAEFLDRWRRPGEHRSQVWEERFGESQYVPLARRAFQRAVDETGVTFDELDQIIVTSTHGRAVRSFVRQAKLREAVLADDISKTVGHTGAAHAGLMLAAALDTATPGQVIAVVLMADGADVMLFRATDHVLELRSQPPVVAQAAAGRAGLSYPKFLTWRGNLTQEPPRRPEPDRPAAPPSIQQADWKFAFAGSVCDCGQAHLPPQRVCMACGRADSMAERRFADIPARVATYTVDHLAFSLSPPTVAAVIDFDGGGRYFCEITDCDPQEIKLGTPVEMTFRRLWTSGDVHNYFWKARPISGAAAPEGDIAAAKETT